MVEKMVQARTYCGPLSSGAELEPMARRHSREMRWHVEVGSGIGLCKRKGSGEAAR